MRRIQLLGAEDLSGDISSETIHDEVSKRLLEGWDYEFKPTERGGSFRVYTPWFDKWTIDRLTKALNASLVFGNREQIQALDVLRFLSLVYCKEKDKFPDLPSRGIDFPQERAPATAQYQLFS